MHLFTVHTESSLSVLLPRAASSKEQGRFIRVMYHQPIPADPERSKGQGVREMVTFLRRWNRSVKGVARQSPFSNRQQRFPAQGSLRRPSDQSTGSTKELRVKERYIV